MSPLTFDELMLRARAADQDAFRIFADRYGRRMRSYIRRSLYPRVRPHFESDEGMDTVLLAFFRSALLTKNFVNEPALLAYLRHMCEFLAAKVNRHFLGTVKWNINREVALPANLPAASTPPDLVAEEHDLWEHFLAGLEPKEQQVLILRRQGFTLEQIAIKLETTTYQVRLVLDRMSHNGDTGPSL